jgi:hypothetical protein
MTVRWSPAFRQRRLWEQHCAKGQQHLKRQHVTEQLQRTPAEHLQWTLSKQLQQQSSLGEQLYP